MGGAVVGGDGELVANSGGESDRVGPQAATDAVNTRNAERALGACTIMGVPSVIGYS